MLTTDVNKLSTGIDKQVENISCTCKMKLFKKYDSQNFGQFYFTRKSGIRTIFDLFICHYAEFLYISCEHGLVKKKEKKVKKEEKKKTEKKEKKEGLKA